MRHKLASFVMASLLMLVASNSYAYYGNNYSHDQNAGYPYDKEYGYRVSRNDLSGPICAR